MRVLAVVVIVLALVIGTVPQFTNCGYAKSMSGATMENTATSAQSAGSHPKCLWSARAEIAVAAPLLIVGTLMLLSRRKESRRSLAIVAIFEGLVTILIPTALIGLCSTATMNCRTTMEPVVLIAGSLVIVAGLAVLVWNELRGEPGAE